MNTHISSKIPVTVLTGFLGAGKTTLLNQILTNPNGKRYAVIVNEFGEIGIDNDLIVDADEEIFELNNGCVCCSVRGDLIRILTALFKRRGSFDGIIIETTGLANPAPVAQTFFADDDIRHRASLDAIITVVDAVHVRARLADSTEAVEQVAFADTIILNKTDSIDGVALDDVIAALRAINRGAPIIQTNRCAIDTDQILNIGAFSLDRARALDPHFLPLDEKHGHDHHNHSHNHGHDHDHAPHYVGISALALRAPRPLDETRFDAWLSDLVAVRGGDILRLKGILSIAGEDKPYAVQGVHMMLEGEYQAAKTKPENMESRIVLIGRNLDTDDIKAEITAGFLDCQT